MKTLIKPSFEGIANFSAVDSKSICLKCYAEVSEEVLYCEKCSIN